MSAVILDTLDNALDIEASDRILEVIIHFTFKTYWID